MPTPPRDDEPDEPLGADVRPEGESDPEPRAEHAQEPEPDAVDERLRGAAREPDHDAAWAAIVAHYGDRPDPGAWDDGEDAPTGRGGHPAGSGRAAVADGEDALDSDLARGPEERFVPPTPPPLPWVSPHRLAAWMGVLGVPVLVLALLLVNVSVVPWVGTLLMVWFVGGFGYLVASMRRDRDGPDDGAVV